MLARARQSSPSLRKTVCNSFALARKPDACKRPKLALADSIRPCLLAKPMTAASGIDCRHRQPVRHGARQVGCGLMHAATEWPARRRGPAHGLSPRARLVGDLPDMVGQKTH